MEELFRFCVTRGVERFDKPGLSLDRGTKFQEELKSVNNDKWDDFLTLAENYLLDSENAWILKFDEDINIQKIEDLLEHLKKGLEKDDHEDLKGRIDQSLRDRKDGLRQKELEDLQDFLSDLFLALLIFRSRGPSGIDKKVRSIRFDLINPPITHISPYLVNIDNKKTLFKLLDRLPVDHPTLDEIADIMRVIDILLTYSSNPENFLINSLLSLLQKTLLLPKGIFSAIEKPIHAVGITDLYLVKQHIIKYEGAEIARVENVMKGEDREHKLKHILTNESEFLYEIEREAETQQELTNNDRTNIRDEIEKTLKEDTKIDAGVHTEVGGDAFKLQADFTVAYDKSSSESYKFAAETAKEVTQKAVKKVKDRIKSSQKTKLIETFDENEFQKFNNTSDDHIIGIYQWLEKIYLAQVFNYGKHMIFDIMVPNPAGPLLKVFENKKDDESDQPFPPDPLEFTPDELSMNKGDLNYYGEYIKKYKISGVEAPPEEYITVSASESTPYENDKKLSGEGTLRIESGYEASHVRIAVSWQRNDDAGGGVGQSPDDSWVEIVIGKKQEFFRYKDGHDNEITPSDHHVTFTREIVLNTEYELKENYSINYYYRTNLVNMLAFSLEIFCYPTKSLINKWKYQTYDRIVEAWKQLREEYETEMKVYEEKKQLIGSFDMDFENQEAVYRQIEKTELKRSCIALLANNYDDVVGKINNLRSVGVEDPMYPGDKSKEIGVYAPDIGRLRHGIIVRWFEQAFLWDKMGYIFYPYFWDHVSNWADKLCQKNMDFLFLQFLQAGYARVVIPVRQGYEAAVNFYMLTGIPWLNGVLPNIGDESQNPLYLSLVEEIKEKTGAPGDEIPVGDPWEIRIPTTIIKLRKELDGTTPTWSNAKGLSAPENEWTWKVDNPLEHRENP